MRGLDPEMLLMAIVMGASGAACILVGLRGGEPLGAGVGALCLVGALWCAVEAWRGS